MDKEGKGFKVKRGYSYGTYIWIAGATKRKFYVLSRTLVAGLLTFSTARLNYPE